MTTYCAVDFHARQQTICGCVAKIIFKRENSSSAFRYEATPDGHRIMFGQEL
jgi:hypothetical protein